VLDSFFRLFRDEIVSRKLDQRDHRVAHSIRNLDRGPGSLLGPVEDLPHIRVDALDGLLIEDPPH